MAMQGEVKSVSEGWEAKYSAEEVQLLEKEGIRLSSDYSLTKDEERELERIRRNIRNKISAQVSRKRKREYLDDLEERTKQCSEKNLHLSKRIDTLEAKSKILAAQVKELQAVLFHGAANTGQIVRLNQSSSSNCDGQKDQDLSQPENKMAPLPGVFFGALPTVTKPILH